MKDLKSFVEVFVSTLAPLGVYSYFMGWVYIYTFLGNFEIDILSVDIPFQYFFIYSFQPIETVIELSWDWLVSDGLHIFAVLLATFLLAAIQKILLSFGIKPKVHINSTAVLYGVVFVAFFACFAAAKFAGDRRADELRRNPISNTHFVMKKDELLTDGGKHVEAFRSFNDKLALRRILESNDTYYVFYQETVDRAAPLPPAHVFKIQKENVAYVQNIRRN
jgi:hypothetical protein